MERTYCLGGCARSELHTTTIGSSMPCASTVTQVRVTASPRGGAGLSNPTGLWRSAQRWLGDKPTLGHPPPASTTLKRLWLERITARDVYRKRPQPVPGWPGGGNGVPKVAARSRQPLGWVPQARRACACEQRQGITGWRCCVGAWGGQDGGRTMHGGPNGRSRTVLEGQAAGGRGARSRVAEPQPPV